MHPLSRERLIVVVVGSSPLRTAAGLVGLGAAAVFVRGLYELYGYRVDIETNIDFDDALPVDGVYGTDQPGDPLVFGVLGDSLVCGKGASSPERTVTVVMASQLAERVGRPVRLVNVGRSGATTAHLVEQTRQLGQGLGPGERLDLACVSIGSIDVANRVAWGSARGDLRTCLHDLTRAGAKVVVAMPVRASVTTSFAGRPVIGVVCDAAMRRRARQQDAFVSGMASRGYHVRSAEMAEMARRFDAEPGYTSGDLTHPSDAGQAMVAEIIVPQLAAALRDDRAIHPTRPLP